MQQSKPTFGIVPKRTEWRSDKRTPQAAKTHSSSVNPLEIDKGGAYKEVSRRKNRQERTGTRQNAVVWVNAKFGDLRCLSEDLKGLLRDSTGDKYLGHSSFYLNRSFSMEGSLGGTGKSTFKIRGEKKLLS